MNFKFCFLTMAVLGLLFLMPGCEAEEVVEEDPVEYEITLSAEPDEGGELSGEGFYEEEEKDEVMVEAHPGEGYVFEKWLEDGEEVSLDQNYSFALEKDRDLTALFVEEEEGYEVEVKLEDEAMGEVSGAGIYQEGEAVTLTAEANSGYQFLHWLEDGLMTGEEEPAYDLVVEEDVEVEAVFSVDQIMPPEFVFDLYHRLAEPEENIFISPVSIYLALSLVYNSAEGETRDEIAELLQVADMDIDEFNRKCLAFRNSLEGEEDGIEVSIADSIWLDEGFPVHDQYLETLQNYHRAEAKESAFADPKTTEKINQWVSDQTEDMIDEVFAEGEPVPARYFVLINAIYFMGAWTEDFDPENTEDKDFTLPDGSTVEVPIMHRESEEMTDYKYLSEDEFEAVRIPYGGIETPGMGQDTRMAMYLFVPDNGLDEFYEQLDAGNWQEWMGSFMDLDGTVGLPRFEMDYNKDLKSILKEMGMEKAFDERADFRAMSPEGHHLYIDEVYHEAVIEVDEKGTEAAAVTVTPGMGEPPEPFEVIADRPFFFVIRDDDAESVLFAGAVTDPS